MKYLFNLLILAIIATGCSSDDQEPVLEDADLFGNWTLREYNLDEAVDINLDGAASLSVLDEVPCFSSLITFNSNGSFISGTNQFEIFVQGQTISIDCGSLQYLSGFWSLEGNQLTTDINGNSKTETIDLQGNSLSLSFNDTNFGSGEFIFQKGGQ